MKDRYQCGNAVETNVIPLRMVNPMKCPKCDSLLLSLYHREGAGGKQWIKVKQMYCKVCKKVVEG